MNYSEIQIHDALRQNDKSLLVKMINDGIDVNKLVIPHNTDIALIAMLHGSHSFFNMILDAGYNFSPDNGILYIHHAIRTNDVYMLARILDLYKLHKFNMNEINNDKETPLLIASKNVNFPLAGFEMLTNAGCSWSLQDKDGNTPLHNLLSSGFIFDGALLDFILENPSLLAIKNVFNITPRMQIDSLINSDIWANNNQKLINSLKV